MYYIIAGVVIALIGIVTGIYIARNNKDNADFNKFTDKGEELFDKTVDKVKDKLKKSK